MDALFANPAGLVAVICLIGVMVIVNLALVALLSGRDASCLRRLINPNEAEVWRKSFTGGRAGQQHQADQLDELHKLVSNLSKPPEAKDD